VLISICCFHGTLKVGAALNATLAVSAMILTLRPAAHRDVPFSDSSNARNPLKPPERSRMLLVLLFATGLTSMGMEVVWIRQFTPYLGTVVYAFAAILSLYLAATFFGSRVYRRWSRNHEREGMLVWVLLGLFALLPLLTADPQFQLYRILRLMVVIVHFSDILSFVTPLLVT